MLWIFQERTNLGIEIGHLSSIFTGIKYIVIIKLPMIQHIKYIIPLNTNL